MQPNERTTFKPCADAHPVGTQVVGVVEDVRHFGVFCQFAEGVQGLLMVTHFGDPPRQFSFPGDYPRIGELIESTVIYINQEDCKITLSRRSVQL